MHFLHILLNFHDVGLCKLQRDQMLIWHFRILPWYVLITIKDFFLLVIKLFKASISSLRWRPWEILMVGKLVICMVLEVFIWIRCKTTITFYEFNRVNFWIWIRMMTIAMNWLLLGRSIPLWILLRRRKLLTERMLFFPRFPITMLALFTTSWMSSWIMLTTDTFSFWFWI